jgi:hypothetical protein
VGVRADILNWYLFPLTAGLVGLALLAIGWRASQRNGYGPVILATLAAIVLLSGKFLLNDPAAVYSGSVLFVMASVWNVLPRHAVRLIAKKSHEEYSDSRIGWSPLWKTQLRGRSLASPQTMPSRGSPTAAMLNTDYENGLSKYSTSS